MGEMMTGLGSSEVNLDQDHPTVEIITRHESELMEISSSSNCKTIVVGESEMSSQKVSTTDINMVDIDDKDDDKDNGGSGSEDDEVQPSFVRQKKRANFIPSDDSDGEDSSPKSPNPLLDLIHGEESKKGSTSLSLSTPTSSDEEEQLLDIPPTTYGTSSSINKISPSSPPGIQSQKSFSLSNLDPDVYGEDSSEGEVRSLHSYRGGNSSNDSDREDDRGGKDKKKKEPKKGKKAPLPRRKASEKAREGILQELTSETQKLARESRISLPYHKPKQLTLDEFLKRRNKTKAPLLESLAQRESYHLSGISLEEDVLPLLAQVKKDDLEEMEKLQEEGESGSGGGVNLLETVQVEEGEGDIGIALDTQHRDTEESMEREIAKEECGTVKDIQEECGTVKDIQEECGTMKDIQEECGTVKDIQDEQCNIDKAGEEGKKSIEIEAEGVREGDERNVEWGPEHQVKGEEPVETRIDVNQENQDESTTSESTTATPTVNSTFVQDEVALAAFLQETKPKPKKLTIKEMLMRMPNYDKISLRKPTLGGVPAGLRVNPKEIIDLNDKKPGKNDKAMDALMARFAKHATAGGVDDQDSKPKHCKIHVNKIEKDSEGMLHSVVDEIDYFNSPPTEEDNDIIAKVSRTGVSAREQVPGEKLFRLKQALRDSIRVKKAKEYEEKMKLYAMYNDEKELEDKCEDDDLPDDEIVEDEEDVDITDSEEEAELDEEDEYEAMMGGKKQKKRKRLIFVEDEAEDEDGDQMSSSDEDEDDDNDADDEEGKDDRADCDKELDVENPGEKDRDEDILESMDITEDSSDLRLSLSEDPKRLSDLEPQPEHDEPIAELIAKTGREIDKKDLDLSNLCSGVFPSQAPCTPFESQGCFGFDEDDDEDELKDRNAVTTSDKESKIDSDAEELKDSNVATTSDKESKIDSDAEELKDSNVAATLDKENKIDSDAEETKASNVAATLDKKSKIDSDTEEDEIVVHKTVKPRRLCFSDDEDEDNNEIGVLDEHSEAESASRSLCDEIDEQKDEYDDDDEEAEYERQLILQKEKPIEAQKLKGLFGKDGRLRKKFVEDEAELSGNEAGSGDEDEHGLNFYEEEDGDEDEMDEEAIRNQVERAHLKHLLDKDDREIRQLQDEYLERGDLEDGKQRERKFRWADVDDGWGDEAAMMGDIAEGGEEDAEAEMQMKLESERRKWIAENSQMLEAAEEESQKMLFENSKVFKLGTTNRKRIETCVESSSSFILNETSSSIPDFSIAALVKSKITVSTKSFLTASPFSNIREVDKDEEDSIKLCRNSSQPMFASPDETASKFKRGSFLSRGSPSLSRLAEITKVNDVPTNVKNNSRNFVFAVVTPPDQVSKMNKPSKRPAHSQGPQPRKLVKMDRAFSNLDDSSKDASIFKWF